VAGGAEVFNAATSGGLVRLAFPGGDFRDVNYLSIDAIFTNPTAR
jgi:hypothetical protein